MLRAILSVATLALGVSVVGGQFIRDIPQPRAQQSESKSFDPKTYFKANCEECHGSAAEKRFNVYNPEGQMIDAILNGAKAEDTKDMPAFNPKGIDESKAKTLIGIRGVPNHLVETFYATMKVIDAVVDCERVFDTIQGEPSARQAISVPSDQGAEKSRAVQISLQRVVAHDHIAEYAVPIRHFDRGDDPAVVNNSDFHSAIVGQSE